MVISSFGLLYSQTIKSFSVDFSKFVAPMKPLANVTAGPGNALQGYKDARIKMIRTNDYYGPCDFPEYTDFFVGDTINPSFDPTDPAHYNWASTDHIITKNFTGGFETFFRLGISFNLTEKSPYWDPPYDYGDTTYNNISEVFLRTAMHFNDGWDNGYNYNIKYWNVWTEPDGGFWNQSLPPTTYYRMYEAVANKFKNYNPDLKIGGPGLLSGSVTTGRQWMFDFLTYCKNHNVPLDFLSWHLYRQHNPYSVKYYAEYMRGILDSLGFNDVENIITETNIDLGASDNNNFDNMKGCSWFASMLITAQNSPLDRLIMYRGNTFMNLLNDDVNGEPSYTYTGLGFKSFSLMADEAPLQIDAKGSEFITDEVTMTKDTTNLMIMASKTEANDACYTLISNFKSEYDTYRVKFRNLPWATYDSIQVTQYLTNDSSRFAESSYYYPAGDSLELVLQNMSSPSVILLKLIGIKTTDVSENNQKIMKFDIEQNYPNPFNPTTKIKFTIPQSGESTSGLYTTLKVYDILGNEVASLFEGYKSAGQYEVSFDAKGLSSGIYVYTLSAGSYRASRKMVIMK